MVFLLRSPRKWKGVIFYLLHLEHLEPNIFSTGSSTSHGDRGAGRLTQGYPGSTSIRVDPEGEPGKDHNQQGWCINTHHVEPNLSSQGEDDLHASVVACQSEKWQVWGSCLYRIVSQTDLQGTGHFYLRKFHKVNTVKHSPFFGDIFERGWWGMLSLTSTASPWYRGAGLTCCSVVELALHRCESLQPPTFPLKWH